MMGGWPPRNAPRELIVATSGPNGWRLPTKVTTTSRPFSLVLLMSLDPPAASRPDPALSFDPGRGSSGDGGERCEEPWRNS